MDSSHLGSRLPHLLLPLVQLLALTLPPFRYRAQIFVPVILALAWATYTNIFTHKSETVLLLVSQWPTFLSTVEKLLFSQPERDYWPLDGSCVDAASLPFGLAKLRWAAALFINPRGIGWNYQVKGIPQVAAPQGKFQFLSSQSLHYMKCYVVTDLVHVYLTKHYYTDGVDMASLTVRANTWSRSFANTLMAGSKVYFPLQLLYTFGSILFVLLSLSKPKDWPPIFGRIRDVTTVRYFWGSFWHQTMRKVGHYSDVECFNRTEDWLCRGNKLMFTSYSQALTRLLGIPRGTQLSSYLQLYVSFAISGLFHALMTFVMPASAQHSFYDRFMLAFNFFILQAIGIHFEDIVIAIYKHVAKESSDVGSPKTRGTKASSVAGKTFVGYVWVVCWFWFSLGWGGDAYLKAGIGNVNDAPYPFVGFFLSYVGL
ncbi:MAG: hypothetical protein M1818_002774 [Claussenomyces sp. TS43310]|nr:MAG: hypothetical protein M1818_002774 [Claussenomyces sp. TS43310]